jgi:hypothetical protein
MTLTEFLLARIDEDEAVAREVARGPRGWGKTTARRRIADCEAKRRIIAECRAGIDAWPATDNDGHFEWILEALALPYADHTACPSGSRTRRLPLPCRLSPRGSGM